MKANLFAVMTAVLVLCSVASAQGYSIRVTYNTNLRAAASLSARVVETAASGTALQVVGNANRWLKINRNGSEVWMANWVSYTRVEGSAQTPSQVASNIDNCCFVDRLCTSDQEWRDGYWAFQNNQCAAPSQSQQQISSQPVSSSPAQVDNCCFVNRQCNTDAEWISGYHAYQSGQCSASAPISALTLVWTPLMPEDVTQLLANPSRDPFNNCCHMHHNTCHSEADWQRGYFQYQNHECIHPAPLGTRPAIVGDHPKFTKLVNDALDLIRIHSPGWLHYIDNSGAREFRLMPLGGSGGFYNQSWTIGHEWLEHERNDPAWQPDFHYIVGYAGGITHEACHAIKQRTYTQSPDWTNEADCEEARLAVIEAINPNSRDVPWLRASVANYHALAGISS